MIRTRHYNRNAQNRKRPRVHPDAELDANLAIRTVEREPSIRGIGVVTPPANVKVTRPRHVRRNQGYYSTNGAFHAYEPAPYLEFHKDVVRRYRPSSGATIRTTTDAPMQGTAQSYADRLARFGATGDQNH